MKPDSKEKEEQCLRPEAYSLIADEELNCKKICFVGYKYEGNRTV